jgi:Ca2+-binding RTX toxin-like protein
VTRYVFGGDGGDKLTGGAQADDLRVGNGRDVLHGEGGVDMLVGGQDDDILKGGWAGDHLSGGQGDDLLIGGGADVFVFGQNSGTDTMQDFADGKDLLQIADHIGDFAALVIADDSADLKIIHDGGVVLLLGQAGTTPTSVDFDFG